MAGAPYQVIGSFSDDETISIPMDFENDDGTPFDLTDYEIEYAVRDDRNRQALKLTIANGITVDAPATGHAEIVGDPGALCPGTYFHFARFLYVPDGRYMAIFDGPLTISEGGF
jgi:hypothetical protein